MFFVFHQRTNLWKCFRGYWLLSINLNANHLLIVCITLISQINSAEKYTDTEQKANVSLSWTHLFLLLLLLLFWCFRIRIRMRMANIMKELSWFWCSIIYDQFNKQKKAEKRQKKNASIVLLLSHYGIILFFLPTSISIVFGSIFKYSNLIWIRLHRNEKKSVNIWIILSGVAFFSLLHISLSLFLKKRQKTASLSLSQLCYT